MFRNIASLLVAGLLMACSNQTDRSSTGPPTAVQDSSRGKSGDTVQRQSYQDELNEQPNSGSIQVNQPLPNQKISSPLTIKGHARGTWFFEASFSVALYDAQKNLLAEGVVQADGEWMTSDFVPFTAQLKFTAPTGRGGKLVFSKANPSGMPENAQTYTLPVQFLSKLQQQK